MTPIKLRKIYLIKIAIIIAVISLVNSLLFAPANAAINNTLNLQFKLTALSDNRINPTTGNPACVVAGANNDACDFRIRIWNVVSGGTATPDNNLLWEELFTNIEIGNTAGTFNLLLNSVCQATPYADGHHWSISGASSTVCNILDDNADADSTQGINFARDDLFIELTFDPSGTWSDLTSPPGGIEVFSRLPVRSVPSALVAQTLGGFTADGFVQLSPPAIQETNNSIQSIRINQQGSGNLLQLQAGGVNKVIINNNGQLQLFQTGSSGGFKLGDSGAWYTDSGDLISSNSFEIDAGMLIEGLSNFKGDLRNLLALGDGSTTTTGTGTTSNHITVSSTSNFNAGNLIFINSTTYARIDAVESSTQLKISPAISWTNGQSVVEYTAASIGGNGTDITDMFGYVYTNNGLKIQTGSNHTSYGDNSIESTRGLNINTEMLNLASQSTIGINSSNGLVINKTESPDLSKGAWAIGKTGGSARRAFSYAVDPATGKLYFWAGGTGFVNTPQVDIYDPATNTWSVGASRTPHKQEHAAAIWNGKMYAWAGQTSGNVNTLDIYDIATDSWSSGASGGTARKGHTMVAWNGKIYGYGGVTTSGLINTLDIYDIATNSWSTGAAGGTARSHHTAAVYNGKMYVWGGSTADMDIYDIALNTWSTGTTGGTPRSSGIAGLYNKKIYYWGGSTTFSTTSNTMDVYDIVTDSWSDGLSGGTPRNYMGGGVVGNNLYIWAGWADSNVPLNTMDIFTFPTSGWENGLAAGNVRMGHSQVEYKGKIYIWGGNVISSLTNTMHIYNPITNDYTAGPTGGTARWEHATAVYNDKMYVWGGFTTGGAVINSMDVFDFKTQTWSTGVTGGTARAYVSAVVYNNKMYIWGGYDGTSQTNIMDIFDFSTNTWSTGLAWGTARYAYSAALYNKKLYIWSGFNSTIGIQPLLEIYDLESNTWWEASKSPAQASGATSVVYNNKMYIWGGLSGTLNKTMLIYDIVTDKWNYGLFGGTPAVFAKSSIYNNKLYIFGGYDNVSTGYNEMRIFNFAQDDTVLKISVDGQEKLRIDTNNVLTVTGQALGLVYAVNDQSQYSTQAWSTGPTGGTARTFVQAVTYNDKMYVWAGNTAATSPTNTIDIFDFKTQTWSTGTPGGTARRGYSAGLYNGKIYYWAGCTNSGCSSANVNTLDIYDIATDTWSTGSAGGTARNAHAGVVYNGKFYNWGGFIAAVTNTMDIYDIATDTWSVGTAGGTARSNPALSVYNGRIIVWSGFTTAAVNTMDIYNIATNTWIAGTNGGTARYAAASQVYNGKLYGTSGCSNTACSTTTTILDVFDFDRNIWQASISGGTGRRNFASAIWNGKLYNWGGTNAAGSHINTMDIFDLGASKSEDVFYISNAQGSGIDTGKLFRFDASGRAYTSEQGGWFSVGADYAEYMKVADESIESGDIVKLDLLNAKTLIKTDVAKDNGALGVISTNPGFVGNIQNIEDINNSDSSMRLLSMTGQVPVKVNTENGPIKVGDSITASGTAGVGMKADEGDNTIGIAQENFSGGGIGLISVLITRNNEGINNKVQILMGQNQEGGFRVNAEGRLQYKQNNEWRNVSNQVEVDNGIAWNKIGQNIFTNTAGTVSIGLLEDELSDSKLQVSKYIEVKSGLKFIKLTAEGSINFGGFSEDEISIKFDPLTNEIQFKDSVSKKWTSLSGLVSANVAGILTRQISGWNYILADGSSNILKQNIQLEHSEYLPKVIAKFVGITETQPANISECSLVDNLNISIEAHVIDQNAFDVAVSGAESLINKYICFNWVAIK